MERVGWIDFLRGLCMLLILLFHTEVYYKEHDVTPYYIYVTNAITLFYFLSGYLFYRQHNFDIKHKLTSIARTLVMPYFIFTSLIAIPKALVHGKDIVLQDIVWNILSGQASWFIAALIVAEIIFSFILFISKGKHYVLSTFSILCFITYTFIPYNEHNYWQWQDALLAVPFLYLGYVYHQYERVINAFHRPLYSLFLLILLFFIKRYEYDADYTLNNIAISNYLLFALDTCLCIVMVIGVIRYFPRWILLEWTGKHCIVYYFLCGGVPLIVSIISFLLSLSYDGHFYRFIIVFILNYLLSTALTWMIYRYIPFITGKKNIKDNQL